MPPVRVSTVTHNVIKNRFAGGDTITEIARDLGLTETTVRKHCSQGCQNNSNRVESEGKQQTYRENLAWALNAAGEYMRTKARQKTCPNDSAWFLYCAALEEPKDFLAKVSAVEKSADDTEGKEFKRSTRKSLEEIERFLEDLDYGKEEKSETAVGDGGEV